MIKDLVHADPLPAEQQNGQLIAPMKVRGWRWAKARMYRQLRAEGNKGEALRIFMDSREARRTFDKVDAAAAWASVMALDSRWLVYEFGEK